MGMSNLILKEMRYFVFYSEGNRVQCSSFESLEEALNYKKKLYDMGYKTYVVHGENSMY